MTSTPGVNGASGAAGYVGDVGDAGAVLHGQAKGADARHVEIDGLDHVPGGDPKGDGVDPSMDKPVGGGTSGALSATVANMSAQQVRVDIYAVMGLLQKVAQEQRTAARETRMAEADAQTSALMAAAGEIRSAAKDRLIGGLISGSLAIGGGVVSMVGAAKEAKALSKTAGSEMPEAGALTKEQAMEINPEQVAKKAALNEQLQKDFGSIQLKKTGEPQGIGALNKPQAMEINPSQVARKAELNAEFTKKFDDVKFTPTASGVAPAASGVAPAAPSGLTTHFPAQAGQPKTPDAGAFTKQQAMEINPSQVTRKADLNAQFTQKFDHVKFTPTAAGTAPSAASSVAPKTNFPAEAGASKTPELTGSALEAKIAAKGKVWQSAAQTITATGGLASEMANFTASLHDARKAELEASASAHDAAASQANDEMQQMQDMLRDIRDKLSAMEQSNIETNRGIARNI